MREPSTNGVAMFEYACRGGNGGLLLRSTTTKAAVVGGRRVPIFYLFVLLSKIMYRTPMPSKSWSIAVFISYVHI
jgi:hypothetical protein